MCFGNRAEVIPRPARQYLPISRGRQAFWGGASSRQCRRRPFFIAVALLAATRACSARQGRRRRIRCALGVSDLGFRTRRPTTRRRIIFTRQELLGLSLLLLFSVFEQAPTASRDKIGREVTKVASTRLTSERGVLRIESVFVSTNTIAISRQETINKALQRVHSTSSLGGGWRYPGASCLEREPIMPSLTVNSVFFR